jgi:hypothetical protein
MGCGLFPVELLIDSTKVHVEKSVKKDKNSNLLIGIF